MGRMIRRGGALLVIGLLAACEPGAGTPQGGAASTGGAVATGGSKAFAPEALRSFGAVAPADIAPPDTPAFNTEQYPDLTPVRFLTTAERGFAVFGLEAEGASYARIARMIREGAAPPANAVRIEELLNAFSWDWPQTADPLTFSTAVMASPWNEGARLLRIAAAAPPAPEDRPPLNLVVMADSSGSMDGPDRMGLMQTALRGLARRLEARDRIAIVDYDVEARLVLPPTPGDDEDRVVAAIDTLTPEGGTNGEAGLQLAYDAIRDSRRDGALNQILVFTDGDFNIGLSEQSAIRQRVEENRDAGVFLNVVGLGAGNLNDQVLQAIAQTGNGVAAYVGDLSDARRVIDDLIAGRTAPAAADVKLELEFNPGQVGAWRLLGYETRPQTRRTFEDDAVDSGEIWVGRSAVALIEFVPPGHAFAGGPAPRYAAAEAEGDEIAFLRARYKRPGEAESVLVETAVAETGPLAEDRFAAAVAGFGLLLREAEDIEDGFDFDGAADLAAGALGADKDGRRRAFVDLARTAALLE